MRKRLLFCLSLWALCALTATVNAEVKTDYTDAIVNAAVSSAEGWNTGEGKHGDGLMKYGSGKQVDFNQTITLPAGQYKMTAQAVYRYGSGSVNEAEQAEYDAIQAGTETHLAKLYAETTSNKYEVNVQNRWEGASETDYFGNLEKVSTVNGLYVPNSSAAVKAWFDNGKYVNELVFNVKEDGQVKIGVAKTESAPNGDYTNIGAWTLTRLGDVQEEQVVDVVFTMVQNEADLVAGEKYLIMAQVDGGWVALSDLYAKTPCYNPSDTLAVNENWTVTAIPATAVSETVGLFLGAPYMLTLEGEAGAWKFKDDVNGAYLYWNPTSKNTLSNDATGSTFAISFNQYAHNAVIELAETAGRSLQYNASSPRFACYTSTQAPVYLFKAGEVSVAPVAPSTPSFTSIAEVLAFEVGNVVELTLNDAKITYLKSNNMSITDGTDTIAVYDYNIPAGYVADGLLSGKITATLSEYKGNKQLTVVDWSEAKMATDYIVNGTFDTAIAPWESTTGAQNKALASNQQGAFNVPFYENWNPNSFTGKMYQVIDSIPNGVYELSICAFAATFDASAQHVYANSSKVALVAGAPTAYTVPVVVVDSTLEVGLEQTAAVNNWMGIDNVKLYYVRDVTSADIVAEYNVAITKAKALVGKAMDATLAQELNAAVEAYSSLDANSSVEELVAAIKALKIAAEAETSAAAYASNKIAIDAMYALMESTNVYTAEAFLAYSSIADNYKAQYEAGTLVGTVDNPAAIHGWHANVDYDDLLLSAWGTKDFDTNLYINTWSVEGETDGSEFKVPFFEYWTGDGESLGATTKTATVTGLEPGKAYEVEAWVRTRAKNGVAAADATGITLNVGTGAAVDVTEGAVVGESQFAHAVYTATGTADENGNLTINFNVLADNNVSWLSFKNLKYSESPCLKTYEVNLVDVKVGDWTTETLVDATTMAEITELLGATAAELTYQLVDTTGVHSNYNGNPGEVLFWVDLEGNLSNWGVNNKFFLLYDSAVPAITSTQFQVAEGDVLNATVRLANAAGQYVEIKITESIYVSPVINIADYEVVSTIKVEHKEAVGVVYSASTATFDPVSAAAALGVASLAEADQYILNITTGNLVSNTTDGWRDAAGDAAPWGSEGGVCVKISDPTSGSIDYIGCIDTKHEVGEVYTAKWAFVHEDKAVVVEVVITFVDGEGIENVGAADKAVTVYTISGRAIQTTVSGLNALDRGIYIVNGKKVYVK